MVRKHLRIHPERSLPIMAKTLYDKLLDNHTIRALDTTGRQVLLYIDRTVLNEYTSPQAFTGLRQAARPVFRPEAALGTVDHVNPTAARRTAAMPDRGAARQASYFAENCRDFGIELFDVLHPLQGIEHVVMTEIGSVLPGMVIAAGDSHTTTYGALGRSVSASARPISNTTSPRKPWSTSA